MTYIKQCYAAARCVDAAADDPPLSIIDHELSLNAVRLLTRTAAL